MSSVTTPQVIAIRQTMSQRQKNWLVVLGILTLATGCAARVYYSKKQANKAQCMVNLSSIQKAWRSEQGVFNQAQHTPMQWKFVESHSIRPKCPSGGEYILYKKNDTTNSHYPPIGTPAATCTCEDHQLEPADTKSW